MEPISTTAAVTLLLSTFKEPLVKKFKDISDEIEHVFNNSLNNYITNYYNKYSKTKTFIYRDEKIDFYEVFYPVTIKNRVSASTEVQELKEVIFREKYITIIGSAGSGKSMLMKHLFLSCIHQFYTIPIVVELRNLNDLDITIFEYISNILTKNKVAKSEKIIDRILKEGNFIFLFDGYDEIFSDNINKITNEIEELVDLYSNNAFVITSRPGANAESFHRFNNYYVQPLSPKQVNEFVSIQFKNHENKESIGKIITVIEKPENMDYLDYFTNPLLLSMFIFTFSSHPEIPRKKSKFYWNVFDTLCTKHDTFTKKGFWLHERKSKLKNEELELILKWFSYISLFRGKYNFDAEYLKQTLTSIVEKFKIECNVEDLVYDLSVSISILIQDGIEYSFPHKSLQEYFVAMLIQSLDEEQKKDVYTKKFKLLTNKTTGGNQNFFRLCNEVDQTSFLKYFIIPSGESYNEVYSAADSLARVKEFLVYFNISLDLVLTKSGKLFGGFGHRLYPIHIFIDFFNNDFLFEVNITNMECVDTLRNVSSVKEWLEHAKVGDRSELFLHEVFNEIGEYLHCTGLINAENNLNKFVRNKLLELNSMIKEESVSTSELLDL
ncbi:NACHT domain-containing protein [Chryseobacterium sp. cx-311]|uniref:NACHT domain-containing protein n=1 Tax=Marnyiella aurantia TaxID=2758037 RepID=UPI001AEB0B49|nr:NACHT domain-containing protein [Marnyiella aurantia]MBP0613017.1 NACHT domain-containing protein [Marnyiella aurantia]